MRGLRAVRYYGVLLLLAVLLQPSTGHAGGVTIARVRARDLHGTLFFGGLTRTYLVHLPPVSLDMRLPLLLLLHRANGSAAEMNGLTHMNALADRYGFMVVYPDGYQAGWADGRGSSIADEKGVDDVGFLTSLIAVMQRSYAVDPRLIAVAGISNGGFMAQRMACERADLIAAAVSVAATLPAEMVDSCRPRRPIPLLFFEGTADPFIPYAGGTIPGDTVLLLSSDATARQWAGFDGCTGVPAVTAQQPSVSDGTTITRSTYARCKGAASVVRYTIWNGGHTWPGGWQYLPPSEIGNTSRNLDASAVIWSFVRAHPLPEASDDPS